MRTSRFSCRRVSLLGRPGENRTLRASAPCRSHAFPPPHHGTGRTPDTSSHFVQGQFRAKKFQRTPAPVGQQVGRTLGSHRDLQPCGDPVIALFYVRAIVTIYVRVEEKARRRTLAASGLFYFFTAS